jgi:5'-nucleotidase (lipoprotein e(P4) family)
MRTRWSGLVGLVVVVAGCAGSGARPGIASPESGTRAGGRAPATGSGPAASAVHWTRDSAEHDALLVQTYRLASEQIRVRSAGHAVGTWGVILDGDETVLDNSTYQKERLGEMPSYTSESWAAWVHRKEATAVPGAAAYLGVVRQLGGRIAIVTNRDEALCADTRSNLSALGLPVDVVLCRGPGGSDKNPRFESLSAGTAAAGIPALDILMWVGDNVLDFPGLSQGIRSMGGGGYGEFGGRFIVLPNPMYGSWESNPWR